MAQVRMRSITRRVRRVATAAEARVRQRAVIAAAAGATTPHAAFADISDRMWLWANTAGYRASQEVRRVIPSLPEEKLQKQFTGVSGDRAMQRAHSFHLLVRDQAEAHLPGGYAGCRDILEFGCGWGRVIRFFNRDFAPDRLTGIDCLPTLIELCQATNPWATFEVVDPVPPTPLASGSFDLVYSLSVFSHLAEDIHLQWITEFHRLLRPGGLLVVTTRPWSTIAKSDLLRAARGRGEALKNSGRSRAFVDSATWQERYAAGEFCHDPVGGAPGLDASFYGETLIPRAYVERVWKPWFELVDYISDRRRCGQDVIVATRV